MPILASQKGAQTAPIPEGSYIARVYQVVHLGTIPAWEGAMQNKVRIAFELPTELHVFKKENGEEPRVLSKEYTLSISEKATLRKVVQACDPNSLKANDEGVVPDFDIAKLIGKTCQISVKHIDSRNGGLSAVIDSVSPLMKGVECPKAILVPMVFSVNEFDQEKFDSLPAFVKDKIKSSDEYKILKGDDTDLNPEDIPF